MTESDVGVVVVAHSRADLALRCIESLGPTVLPEHVVVVVNARAALDPAAADELERSARVASPPRPQGYGANLNLGVRLLPEGLPYWLLTNDDVEFAGGAVEHLARALRDDPTIGLAGPALHDSAGRLSPSRQVKPFPSPLGALLDVAVLPLGRAWTPLSRRAGAQIRNLPADGYAEGWISGAAMLVRADAFRGVGGFDADFFLYYEETDFCFRLRRAGWNVVWVPAARAVHLGASSTADPRYERIALRARRLYLRKRLGRTRLAALQTGQAAVVVVALAYNLAAAAIRPRTARVRLATLRSRVDELRVFFVGRG